MLRNKCWQIIFAALLIVALAGCTPKAVPESTDSTGKSFEDIRINIATATTSGGNYPAGIAIAQLWSTESGVQASASTSAGAVENVDLLSKGEAQIGFVQTDILVDSYNGTGQFDGKPHGDLRVLLPALTNNHNIVIRKGIDIKSVADWKGRQIVIGRPGSGTAKTHEDYLRTFGLTLDDIKQSHLGQTEAVEAIRNGQADAAIVTGAAPVASISDAMATVGSNVDVYSLTAEEQSKLLEANPWMVSMNIPAQTYPNQTNEVRATGHITYLVVRADFPEDLAYDLVKLLCTEREQLHEAYSGLNNIAFNNPGDYAAKTGVPLHPASERYLKEAGLL